MTRLAPGVPSDYYEAIYRVEIDHWWQRGMRRLSATVLGDRLTAPGIALLDVGCGTGGFLRFAADAGAPSRLCGIDVSSAAVELAHTRVARAELDIAAAWDIPHEDDAFDLIVMNDVLQHLPEGRVHETLCELARVQAPRGALLLRTGAAIRTRRERDDWRAYDRRTLAATVTAAGYQCERVTYVNLVPSLWALAHGARPHAPSEQRHGVARSVPGGLQSAVASRALVAEARYLRSPGHSLPYGHTLLALASAPT